MMKIKIAVLIFGILQYGYVFSQWQVVPSGVSNSLKDGCFLNDSTIVIISNDGVILKSSDYGENWIQTSTLSGSFSKIIYAGNDTLYAGGNQLFRSTDGGINWVNLYAFPTVISDLVFFGSKNGYAIIPNYDYCTWFDGTHSFDVFYGMKTSDYGFNWASSLQNYDETSKYEKINDSTVYYTSGYRSIVSHCAGPWGNTSRKTFSKGNTWVGFAQPMYGNTLISFIDPDTGYYYTKQTTYGFYKTYNGGSTISPSYSEFPNFTKKFEFINNKEGYLITNNSIYSTGSIGYYWDQEFDTTVQLNQLVNQNNFLIVLGANGIILKKTHIENSLPDTIYRAESSRNTLNFGYVCTGDTKTDSTIIKNVGTLTQTVTLISSLEFPISLDGVTFSDSITISLNSLADTNLLFRFSPSLQKTYQDTLIIKSYGMSDLKIPLSAIGFTGLTGTIINDTLLCADTIFVGDNVFIPDSVIIEICPGTFVNFLGNFEFHVQGNIICNGTINDSIIFGKHNTNYWKGIRIESYSYSDTNIFNFCRIDQKCYSSPLNIRRGLTSIQNSVLSNPSDIPNSIIDVSKYFNKPIINIRNNIIKNGRANGISFSECDTIEISNNIIEGNLKAISGGSTNSYAILIENNIIRNNLHEGIYVFANPSIINNIIFNNGGGIYVIGNVTISNNIIYNNSSTFTGGISVATGNTGSKIIQNVIFNNQSDYGNGAGLAIAPSSFAPPTIVMNNTICNNKVANDKSGNDFYATINTSYGLSVDFINNLIYNIESNTNNFAFKDEVVMNIRFNSITQEDATNYGISTISDKPFFIHSTDSSGTMTDFGEDFNWNLRNFSVQINAGDTILHSLFPANDIINLPRIYNGRIDIGAYEVQENYVPIETKVDNCVFPNPFLNEITSNIGNNNASIMIYSIEGRLLYEDNIYQEKIHNLSQLAIGTYLYKIYNGNEIICTGKLNKVKN